MPENQNKDREMSRVDAVRIEMASAVRYLGSEAATVKEATNKAARASGLPTRLIERLRYRKVGRIAADVADAVRDAVAAHQAKQEALARHEISILRTRLQALENRFQAGDSDFHQFDVAPGIEPAGRPRADDLAVADGAAE